MAGGLDGVRAIKCTLLKGHLQKVPLHRLAQALHAQLHIQALSQVAKEPCA